jgi:hypothetical protein
VLRLFRHAVAQLGAEIGRGTAMRLEGEVLTAIETMNGEAECKEEQSGSQQRKCDAGNSIEVEHFLMCERPLNTRRWAWLAS